MGLNYDYFYSLTPRVFYNIQEGYKQRVESEYKDNWIRTRKLMYAMLKPHLKNSNTNESDLFVFPWETMIENSLNDEITNEEEAERVLKEQEDYWDKIDLKRKNKLLTNNVSDGISTS